MIYFFCTRFVTASRPANIHRLAKGIQAQAMALGRGWLPSSFGSWAAAMPTGREKIQHLPQVHGLEHSLCQRQHGFQADFFSGALEGDVALAPLSGGIEQTAFQRHAHVAADIHRRCLPAGEGSRQPVLCAVVIVAEGMADVADAVFFQCFNEHVLSLPF